MTLRMLEPDAFDLYHASHVTLKPCPFCGGQSVTPLSFVNHDSTLSGRPVYRTIVSCAGCRAEVGYNAATREEAREKAMECWNRRTT